MRLFVIVLILFFNVSFASEFGQYRYSQYLGLQQQLQNQRYQAIRRQKIYQQIPTRNIRYPSSANQYPNIQRNSYHHINPRQRYSAQYYKNL